MINTGFMLRLCTPEGLGYLFTKTPNEIWNFFEYLAHNTWEYENARETFSCPSPDPYIMHAKPLFESQIESISYEHSHAPCAPVSCDYCYSFDYDIDTYLSLSRQDRLEALATLIGRFTYKVYSRLTLV